MRSRFVLYITGLLSFLLLWQICYWLLDNHMIPSPISTLVYFYRHFKLLFLHALASSLRILIAVILALFIGIPSGITLGTSPKLRKIFDPLIYFMYPIPKVAFLPVFMILFGLGNVSKILLVVLIVVFQVVLSIRDGVLDIDENYYKVLFGMTSRKSDILRYIILPATLPRMISGTRISVGIALASLFFAENYATTYGLGYFILSTWTKMDYPAMFGGIMALGIVGMVFYSFIDLAEGKLAPWR
ncbi:MAG: ABC transporter permease [Lachnospiraceae bacterium]